MDNETQKSRGNEAARTAFFRDPEPKGSDLQSAELQSPDLPGADLQGPDPQRPDLKGPSSAWAPPPGLPADVAASARESAVAATPAVEALIDGRRPVASLLDVEFFAAFEELAARKRMLDATLALMAAK